MTHMKYIFYLGLALLMCAGCSKDDSGSVKSLPDAKITLQFKAAAANGKVPKAVSKAGPDANELAGEANINNITAFVFNQDGSELLATPYYTDDINASDGIVTITNIPAKATMAQIILIANAGGNTFGSVATYSDLESMLCKLDDQSQTSLAMSTQVIETTKPLVVGDENYLGYTSMGENNINNISTPLELTRLAARLDVVGIKTKFTRPELVGRTVTIESIAVANQKTASRFFSHDYWGAVVAAGNLGTSPSTPMDLVVDNNTSLSEIAYRTYVMENDGSEQPTELLIKATISAKDPYQARTREFRAVINEKGLSAYGHNFVKRNYVYKIIISFNDDSFEEEELYGSVNINIVAAEWNSEVINIPSVDY